MLVKTDGYLAEKLLANRERRLVEHGKKYVFVMFREEVLTSNN